MRVPREQNATRLEHEVDSPFRPASPDRVFCAGFPTGSLSRETRGDLSVPPSRVGLPKIAGTLQNMR